MAELTKREEISLAHQLEGIHETIDELWEIAQSRENVAIFVDNSEIFEAIRNLPKTVLRGRRMDYIKLKEHLADSRNLGCAYFYFSEPQLPKIGFDMARKAAEKRETFYYALERGGYFTICVPQTQDFRAEESFSVEPVSGDVIYDMCALSRMGKYDTFILVAGDASYARTVKRLRQDTGITVEVAFFGSDCSPRLKEAANHFTDLSESVDELFMEVDKNAGFIKEEK